MHNNFTNSMLESPQFAFFIAVVELGVDYRLTTKTK